MDANELRANAKARMAVLQAEIATIKGQTADKRAALEQLAAEASALNARVNLLAEEIKAVEYPRVFDLKRELGQLARMAGGY